MYTRAFYAVREGRGLEPVIRESKRSLLGGLGMRTEATMDPWSVVASSIEAMP